MLEVKFILYCQSRRGRLFVCLIGFYVTAAIFQLCCDDHFFRVESRREAPTLGQVTGKLNGIS